LIDNAHLKIVLDAAIDGIVCVDRSGLIVSANTATEELFGWRIDELISKSLIELLSPRFRDSYRQGLVGFLKAGDDYLIGKSVELTGVKKDGSEFPMELSLGATRVNDKVFFTAIMRDITERKKADYEAVKLAGMIAKEGSERRKTQEQIIRKNLELETLLYVTSHDLKEPLRAIANFSRLVSSRYSDKLDEKGQDFLKRIVAGSTRMNQLLDDILEVCRAGQMEAPATNVDAEKIVRSILSRLEAKIKESSAKVTVVTPMPLLRVNGLWASQAVYNLVLNALKFTRDGEPPEIEIAPYETETQVGVVVKDRGPGVPAEHRERIFQLFQRAVGREVEGTGAGLAIVRQIARRHAGNAWTELRYDGGSAFIITFGPPPTGTEDEA
jgi:PAS domain S-box-containing protein